MTEKQHVCGACPMDCPDTCSWIVTIEDGRAVKLEGDRAHPFTRGALCNKLNDYVAYTQSPERLLFIRIHPEDAEPRRIETGDEVRLFNDRGSFSAVAEITDYVRKGVVAGTKGRWPRHTTGGATVNATVDERYSDMGGGAVFHDNRVEVEKVSA